MEDDPLMTPGVINKFAIPIAGSLSDAVASVKEELSREQVINYESSSTSWRSAKCTAAGHREAAFSNEVSS